MGDNKNQIHNTNLSNKDTNNTNDNGNNRKPPRNFIFNTLAFIVFLLLLIYYVRYFTNGNFFNKEAAVTLKSNRETESNQIQDKNSLNSGGNDTSKNNISGSTGESVSGNNETNINKSANTSEDIKKAGNETGKTSIEDDETGQDEGKVISMDENSEESLTESSEESRDERTRVKVKGIYITGPMAGTKNSMKDLIHLVDTTELNTMVIDIKNDNGEITFDMDLPMVQKIGADVHYIHDMKSLISELKEKNIYLIARVVAFKDPLLAKKVPELSIKNKDGSIFRDDSGLSWVNPYKKEVWSYLVSIGKEAAKLGFDEVQFDYIRFSTDSAMKNVDFGKGTENKTKEEVITDFTKYACEELKPTGVFVSADVYGTIIDSKVDAAIVGQDYKSMSKYLDFISPMIYPSHYADGVYGITHPDLEPYNIISEALKKSQTALDTTGKNSEESEPEIADVRPWLQDFTASWVPNHKTYGAKEIRAQIQAVYDAGYEEWILWNGKNKYTEGGLLEE